MHVDDATEHQQALLPRGVVLPSRHGAHSVTESSLHVHAL
jgi:hypothetical protein